MTVFDVCLKNMHLYLEVLISKILLNLEDEGG
jgi:hypothetical protein